MPDPDALAHSARLRSVLAERISAAGGWIDFADFMSGLLYTPGLGYYAAGAARFNAAGDFTTAPETGPLFARTLARAIAPVLRCLQGGEVLEPGAGTGALAANLLPALAALDALPARYAILEPSPALRAEQRARLASLPAVLSSRVVWLDDLPARHRGVVVANEVLDAMPVHVLRVDEEPDGIWRERGVALDQHGQFCWSERPARSGHQAAFQRLAPPDVRPLAGASFELALAAQAWSATLGSRLSEGMILLIDYGYPARELHHARRDGGTLMCHYRHHAHPDPFFLPGLQDVTAHVDFSAIGASLRAVGLQLQDFDSQAAWLLAQGVLDTLDPAVVPGSLAWIRQSTELQQLVSPAVMGETFKVLVAVHDPNRRLAAALTGPGDAVACRRLGLAP
jgi:SAM-dependent MidA family methyltransferase